MTNWIVIGLGIFCLGCSIFLIRELISEYKIKKKHRKNYEDIKTTWVLLFYFISLSILVFYFAFTVLSPQEQLNKDCEKNLSRCVLVNESCPDGLFAQSGSCWQERTETGTVVYSGRDQPKSIENYRLKNECELSPRYDETCACDYQKVYLKNGDYPFELMENATTPDEIFRILKSNGYDTVCTQSHERTWQEVCGYKNMTYKKLLINNAKVSEYSGQEYEVCVS